VSAEAHQLAAEVGKDQILQTTTTPGQGNSNWSWWLADGATTVASLLA